MLPSELLRVRVQRGQIFPIYTQIDSDSLGFAEELLEVFKNSVGKKKGELEERLKTFEDSGFDYRFVRGLSTLLERRCIFEAESIINPKDARIMVFEEASREKVVSAIQRENVLKSIASKLKISRENLEKTLHCDIDEELIIRDFTPIASDLLLRHYNLSITQTLLFKSLKMEFTSSENWQNIFRSIKMLGLMYSVQKTGQGYMVSVDGPLSLFKMTDRYGTALARLLPQIFASRSWKIKADVLGRNKNRIYTFELGSDEAEGLMKEATSEDSIPRQSYDSLVEQQFARSFNSCDSGWRLQREPEPLIAGNHVLIPDFMFTKNDLKVYLEIVGFWTQDYLERKISKLESLTDIDIIVAINEEHAGSKLHKIKAKVIFFKNKLPIKPIIEHLKKREKANYEVHAKAFTSTVIKLEGDLISVDEIAMKYSVPVESVKEILESMDFEGYKRIGDIFISISKLNGIDNSLRNQEKLSDALSTIEAYNIKEPYGILHELGYTVEWNGLDLQKSKIKKSTKT
jgi:hypothetical protein